MNFDELWMNQEQFHRPMTQSSTAILCCFGNLLAFHCPYQPYQPYRPHLIEIFCIGVYGPAEKVFNVIPKIASGKQTVLLKVAHRNS